MSHTSPIALIVMIAWIPVVQVLFMMMPTRRAVIAAYLGAWLFLPVVLWPLPMLPDFSKMFATSVGVLIAVTLFDPGRFGTLRPRIFDAPMLAWCVVPFFSSMTNGLGPYDGVTACMDQTIIWGLPYLVGRLYFTDLRSMRELAIGLVIGGLIYVPLCLFEARMSPQLHRWVYGFHAHSFLQTKRFGGWRPTVFMQHGLMVAMWMTATALVGLWMWRTRALRQVWGVPMVYVCGALCVGVLVMKSVTAWLAFALGVACLLGIRYLRTPALVAIIAVGVPGYMAVRTVGGWDGSEMVRLADAAFGYERSTSLQARLTNEDLLADKALRQPVFGWGRWGRNRVYDEYGNDISITDGLWVIALGQTGLVGLAALTCVFLTPAIRVRMVVGKRGLRDPAFAAPVVLAVLLVLAMMDNLLNAMVNPIFTLVAGGLAGLTAPRRAASAPARREMPPEPGEEPVEVGAGEDTRERAA